MIFDRSRTDAVKEKLFECHRLYISLNHSNIPLDGTSCACISEIITKSSIAHLES